MAELVACRRLDVPHRDTASDFDALSRPDSSVAALASLAKRSKHVVTVPHQLADGETLWDIARAYGTSVEALREANDLSPQDFRRLRPGDLLRIPGATHQVDVETARDRAKRAVEESAIAPEGSAFHTLADGETLWDLSRSYDRSVDELIALNGFSDSELRALRPGRQVAIPNVTEADIQRVRQADTALPAEMRGIRHEIAEGETVWDLARGFQVSVSEIMGANRLSAAEVTALRPGTKLFIPGVSADRRGHIVRRKTASQRRAQVMAERLGLGTRQAASKLLGGRIDPSWLRAASQGRDRFVGTLRWPVTHGGFVRGYGSGEGGYHLAVDISGDIGWNVRAAAEGIVGYAGDGVRGYGNMVIVIHPGGWITMYAHNSVNFVVAGERVPRGGILAEVGSTGISRGPHVHFEFLYNGKNCDPATLFRPGLRHRNGTVTPLKRERWDKVGERPAPVRCAPRRRHPRSRWVVNE